MNTLEKLKAIKSGRLTARQNIINSLKEIDARNKDINAILHINQQAIAQADEVDKKIKKGRAGKLAGLAIAVKSIISVKGMIVNCASRTLENYTAGFDADVIARVRAEDGIIIGMANMDEFAMGASGESSAFGKTDNPRAPGHIPGGSSSGPVAAVAACFCDLALGSDTGGSIRNPASHCGVIGIKPSYGRVSRYGLVDMAMSLDTIGPVANDTVGAALLLEVIAGHSIRDAVTFKKPVPRYSQAIKKPVSRLRVGLSPDFEKLCTDKRIYRLIQGRVSEFSEKTGSRIVNVSLKNVDLAVQTYYPIVYVEVFSSTRKFDGRKYGKKIEDVCGEEVLRRILGGKEISRAEYHGTYYRKALAARRLIAQALDTAFKSCDVIMLPTTPMLPHRFGTRISTEAMYAYDAYTIPASLAGICAGVVPAGCIDSIPVGLQIFVPAFSEDLLCRVMAACFELYQDEVRHDENDS
ncbi:hypothetical protein AUJ69_04580 [Candidatus Woesearchaeota archaeon CG1_02_47_18]|nr:MAG: hypothetical protein AUJ69_04580 [Candidatus Woesearchaeota archaeon CG1_02_47_18]HII29809.1 Asp-tRNA(Asn)/Glu-tRNA(Gln) amidotransferase subunit GatA [Candidatus Woesearchaeota archaeon]